VAGAFEPSIVLLVMSLAAAQRCPCQLALALVLGANVGGSLAPFLTLYPARRRPAAASRSAIS
jgi:Na+/phosphate symporter